MTAACRFSIVIPVYNVEKYLERCVTSMEEQEFKDYEVILVDDGSTDGSGEICDRLALKNHKIRVFHRENRGVSSARNYGMDKADGEYVLFVDADDYVDHNFFQKLDHSLKIHGDPEVAVYGGREEEGSKRKVLSPPETGKGSGVSGREYLLLCYKENHLSNAVWTYACRKAFLKKFQLHFEEGIYHEDVEFIPRMLLCAERLVRVDMNPYHYCVRQNSISTQKHKEKNVRDLFWVLHQQVQLADRQEPELRKWMRNGILNSYLNMVQEAEIYRPEYRKYFRRRFLWGKAATVWNHMRVVLCTISPRLYCEVNDIYKKA